MTGMPTGHYPAEPILELLTDSCMNHQAHCTAATLTVPKFVSPCCALALAPVAAATSAKNLISKTAAALR
jgi:hypothetical protein